MRVRASVCTREIVRARERGLTSECEPGRKRTREATDACEKRTREAAVARYKTVK